MSNRNLQKHLPQGLDEHNFQDGLKATSRLRGAELETRFQSAAEIKIYTGIHFCMSSYKLLFLCLIRVVCLWSPSITAKSYIFT